MEIRPNYYDEFKCIADKCKHNCCIGWEIGVDDPTLQKYEKLSGPLAEKLQKNIALEPYAHFVLSANGRCPFLNDNNLCELILAGGEDLLCQICDDHPRFYNYVYDITEKGLGISCEAAAKIVLERTEPFELISSNGKLPQNDFYKYRNKIFSILQNREKPLTERIDEVLKKAEITVPTSEIDWVNIYRELERLDKVWDKLLDRIDVVSKDIPKNLEYPCEQLLCYFIYRHLSVALDDFMFSERLQFAVLSLYIILSICKESSFEAFLEVSRMYSCEIEYSDENIDILLEKLQEYNEK